MSSKRFFSLLCAGALTLGCCVGASAEDMTQKLGLTPAQKTATQFTADANAQVYALLDFEDKSEFENATRGLIASPETLEIRNDEGKLIWSQKAYDFLDGDAPSTANPSLWRNTQLNHIYGLFEVCEGIYQVRGYDLSNITFIKGDTGWIVFDPLMSTECAKAALELVNENLGVLPIKAVVYSHSHVDHFGGVLGIVTPEQVQAEGIAIIAPEHFEEHAVSENVYAGTAMARRASYQYGSLLEKGAQGALALGIGMSQSNGTVEFLSPNTDITHTGQELEIDGVTMVFQLTPDTEAPAEMNTWFPQKQALWLAENCTGTLHNLYTLRGAQVRDGNAWAEYIMESLALYGQQAQVVFQAHNWPHWGNENIQEYMTNTAAVYKFINDQTLLYINQGYTEAEIANMIRLPEAMEKVWYTRQYYGTVSHNAKAVYAKYMGWYDANPVHLLELTPTEEAKKLVQYLGDTNRVLEMAKQDYDNGEYQWVAQITNTLVFADPENLAARYLCADALEQLGYQAESGAWRNAYLVAAYELRNGIGGYPQTSRVGIGTTAQGMDEQTMLDYMGIMLDAKKLADKSFTVRLKLTDGENYLLKIHHGVLLYYKDEGTVDADLTLLTVRTGILAIANGDQENIDKLVTLENGNETLFHELCGSMAAPEIYFNIIEP